MDKILTVFIGGGAGAVTRYLVSAWAAARYGAAFPYGTLIVNVVGCFLIGAFMAVTERINLSPYWRLIFTTGFCGGLTTFSSFSYETLKLALDGNINLALYNILANCALGFAATWLGLNAVRII